MKRELAEMTAARDKSQWTLDTERETNYNTYCEGRFRGEQEAPAAAAEGREISLRVEMRQVKWNNSRYLSRAKVLAAERAVLLEELAQAKGALTVAKKTIEQMARREVLNLRARGREDKKLEALVQSVQEEVECAQMSLAEVEARAAAEEECTAEAQRAAEAAREEALAEMQVAHAAKEAQSLSEYQSMLLKRQVERAQSKAGKLEARLNEVTPIAADRSSDDWAALRADARRKAAQVERDAIRGFLQPHSWRAVDLAAVLDEQLLLEKLFNTAARWRIYFAKLKVLHTKLEQEDFGLRFGL